MEASHRNGGVSMNAYSDLSPSLRGELDKYLDTLSKGTLHGDRAYCSRFLYLLQESGLQTVSEVSIPELIAAIDTIMSYENKHDRESLLSSTKRFLLFESEKDIIYDCLGLMLKYYPRNQVLFFKDFTEDEQLIIANSQQNPEMSAEEFHQTGKLILQMMEEMNYCHWHVVNLTKLADLHYLFLSAESLSFCKETYMVWKKVFVDKVLHGPSIIQNSNRLLGFVEQWQSYGRIIPEKNYRLRILPYDTLPTWCRETLDAFLLLKKKEGWKPHTIQMYRSSVTRFCVYLAENGFSSFAELTPDVIKKFNLQDKHRTPEGKNAYNSRIRKFLDYLEEKHLISSRMLSLALPCVSAPSTRLVITLTEEEDRELERLILSDDSPLTLREKAMLALGRYLGMRESDIVGLRGSDIDLKNRTINFVQKKTGYENTLPFSVKVGNILFRYIMEERPETDDPHIFIRNYAPYSKVRDSAACDAFNKAFPDRDVPGSNFHSLRKTFSSGMLKNGVKANTVAEADGHRSMDSVHVYLNTDGENMRKCARSMEEAGISMKGTFPL